MVAVVFFAAACESTPSDEGTSGPKLVVTERSATTLKLQWDAFSASGWYTVDLLVGQPFCTSFPMHSNGTELAATTLELTALTPSTRYHIHVHALDGPHGMVANTTKSQTAFVTTLAAGSAPQPVTASQYEVCQ